MGLSEQLIPIAFIITCWSDTLFVFIFPTSNTGAVEFFMRKTHRSALHTYGLQDSYDSVFESEDSFDNLKKCLDPLRAKKTFIRQELGHTVVSAI